MFKVYDYQCETCGKILYDKLAEKGEIVSCETCLKPMVQLFPCPRSKDRELRFQPFYSDTFEMHVNDREDLSKLKDLRKKHGLECVGHRNQRPERTVIRHNYESE